MKVLLLLGLIVLVLGICSFFVPIPRHESEGIKVGDATFGVQVKHEERLPPWVGGVLIVGGIGMMIAGGRSKAA